MNNIAKITRINKKTPGKLNLEEEMMKNICNDAIKDTPSSSKVKDSDLLITMTKRLQFVEKENKDNKLKVQELLANIEKLKKENENLSLNLNKEKDNNANPNCQNCEVLKKQFKLQKEYSDELKEFIKEQGFLIMKNQPELGDDRLEFLNNKIKNLSKELDLEIDLNDEIQEEYEEDDDIHSKIPKEIDINVISRRLEEMNMLIYKDGNSKFEKDSDQIFKLRQNKELKIFFYKNGLIIEGYKFYKFDSIEAKRILNDILDGYSPYIMRKLYPDGAILQLVNNLHKDFEKEQTNFKTVSDNKVKNDKMTGEEFLKKFPEKVIRNGKVYNIREDMEQFLVVKKNNEYNLDQEELFINCNNENLDDKSNCKLKIKLIIVDKIITVNIDKMENFKVLFKYIVELINGKKKKNLIEKIEDYVLYSTYPFKVYHFDEILNLDSCGLYPSYFLIFDASKNLNK